MSAAALTAATEPVSWDSKHSARDYQPSLPAAPTASVIPKTVEYGHGHGKSGKGEHVSLLLLIKQANFPDHCC